MLPLELYDRLRCHPRQVVVKRYETEKTYGGVIMLPDSYTKKVKSMTAEVLMVGDLVEGYPFKVGSTVLLSSGIGRTIVFGEDDLTVYVCRPEEIECVIFGDSSVSYADLGHQDFARYFPQAFEERQDERADEGMPRG